MNNTRPRPASPAQIKFASDLMREHLTIIGTDEADITTTLEAASTVWTAAFPPNTIDSLKAALAAVRRDARATASASRWDTPAVEPLAEGCYMKDAEVYKVQRSRRSGNLYAKVLHTDPLGWEYAPGAVRLLSLADRITMQQAQEFGARFGVCAICGRTLTDPESIDRGIGPRCASRL